MDYSLRHVSDIKGHYRPIENTEIASMSQLMIKCTFLVENIDALLKSEKPFDDPEVQDLNKILCGHLKCFFTEYVCITYENDISRRGYTFDTEKNKGIFRMLENVFGLVGTSRLLNEMFVWHGVGMLEYYLKLWGRVSELLNSHDDVASIQKVLIDNGFDIASTIPDAFSRDVGVEIDKDDYLHVDDVSTCKTYLMKLYDNLDKVIGYVNGYLCASSTKKFKKVYYLKEDERNIEEKLIDWQVFKVAFLETFESKTDMALSKNTPWHDIKQIYLSDNSQYNPMIYSEYALVYGLIADELRHLSEFVGRGGEVKSVEHYRDIYPSVINKIKEQKGLVVADDEIAGREVIPEISTADSIDSGEFDFERSVPFDSVDVGVQTVQTAPSVEDKDVQHVPTTGDRSTQCDCSHQAKEIAYLKTELADCKSGLLEKVETVRSVLKRVDDKEAEISSAKEKFASAVSDLENKIQTLKDDDRKRRAALTAEIAEKQDMATAAAALQEELLKLKGEVERGASAVDNSEARKDTWKKYALRLKKERTGLMENVDYLLGLMADSKVLHDNKDEMMLSLLQTNDDLIRDHAAIIAELDDMRIREEGSRHEVNDTIMGMRSSFGAELGQKEQLIGYLKQEKEVLETELLEKTVLLEKVLPDR
jgi:hypothetical protein